MPLGVQTRYESILDFVCVAQDVPFVEVQKIRKVIDSGHVAVLNSRLDHMLPFSAQELLIENLFQPRRTYLHGSLKRLAVRGVGVHDSVDVALGVEGLVQGQGRAQYPSIPLQGKRNLRIEIEPSQQIAGAEPWFASRKARLAYFLTVTRSAILSY